VNIINELVGYFKDPQILNTNVKMSFTNEKASDVDGVSREAYTLFWLELYEKLCEGEAMRVPSLCSGWQATEWQSVARILLKGYNEQKIFPLRLSPAFMCAIIYGEDNVPNDVLLESFYNFISPRNKQLIELAM
jgi:hypothetical protein